MQNTSNSYHEQPDHAFQLATSEPSLPDPPPPVYRGRFVKGHDPRRHKLTRSECQLGFQRALESIVIRYPNAVMRDGRHIAVNFLRSRLEQAF